MDSPLESRIQRCVRMLLITGAWLDELVSGLSAELPSGSYPGEEPRAVILEMLCGTIGTALQSTEPRELRLATELIDLAGSRVEEHLRLVCELSPRGHAPADDEPGPVAEANGRHRAPMPPRPMVKTDEFVTWTRTLDSERRQRFRARSSASPRAARHWAVPMSIGSTDRVFTS